MYTTRTAPGFLGSPPQVRGKRNISASGYGFRRITPAGAGKTTYSANYQCASKDHPRRCGENVVAFSTTPLMVGSPPQVRGKLVSVLIMIVLTRITPAGAGKTALAVADGVPAKDHPRRCGENLGYVTTGGFLRGSPPQVRGKLLQFIGSCRKARITPAGAGKTERPVSAV